MRIYVSDHGSDKNDGLTRETPIHSWKRARKISGHMEISVDSVATRKRLMRERCGKRSHELRPLQRAND